MENEELKQGESTPSGGDVGCAHLFADLRDWLQMHNNYSVRINPWGIYGCWYFEARIFGERIIGRSLGKTLEKRILEILEVCKAHFKANAEVCQPEGGKKL